MSASPTGTLTYYAAAVAQVVDFYLDAAHAKEHAEVVRLACAKDAASRESLRGYVREAQRMSSYLRYLIHNLTSVFHCD